jgi:excinuclease ABC subunit A
MADIFVTCEVCKGKRYNHEITEYPLQGKEHCRRVGYGRQEAVEFFDSIPSIRNKL